MSVLRATLAVHIVLSYGRSAMLRASLGYTARLRLAARYFGLQLSELLARAVVMLPSVIECTSARAAAVSHDRGTV